MTGSGDSAPADSCRGGSPAISAFGGVVIAAAGLVGSAVGTAAGLAIGLWWDEITANDFVSSALLTIPLGGIVGAAVGLFLGWRIHVVRSWSSGSLGDGLELAAGLVVAVMTPPLRTVELGLPVVFVGAVLFVASRVGRPPPPAWALPAWVIATLLVAALWLAGPFLLTQL